ncbi:acetyl-CoA carboxylase, biotin carboxyl carrier protein [Sphingobium chlorophenolicum L-1]|uniref:Biotin carboxyl carrier protein of acetyl-CoA carboxylase n=1 Tax=Sphingobium chlorophenolicum L-1 TaxID=690566 RepID=F6F002_SPHCR|nr:acetyl-CoA carboxylase biotin carboxyl carrier protein [Sphingobium chlorophenolicum]AEG49366.1 acetyl-CoA carboxylase, biotin carboxyl carrier protein [Sphingobium chlorophenolicum L-1]
MNDKAEKGAMQVDVQLVRDLAALLDDTNLTEIEVEDGDRKIRVARKVGGAAPVYAPAPVVAAPAAVAAPAPAAPAEAAAPAAAANAIRSPIVGTAYLAAEPGAAPYAAVGSTVKAGDTVLIVEAMKVMNAITAPHAGTVKAVLVDNGQPVEYDQPLIVIE